MVLFCCQRPLQQETKKKHHEVVANCCVWLQSYTTSRWTPKHKVKRRSDVIQNTAVAQVWDSMLDVALKHKAHREPNFQMLSSHIRLISEQSELLFVKH